MLAFVIAEIFHSKPIYEELLNRSLNAKPPQPQIYQQRNIAEIAVCNGSKIAGKMIKDITWPENTLLVDIKRGEKQIVPNGEIRILPGDFLYILTENEHIEELQNMAS